MVRGGRGGRPPLAPACVVTQEVERPLSPYRNASSVGHRAARREWFRGGRSSPSSPGSAEKLLSVSADEVGLGGRVRPRSATTPPGRTPRPLREGQRPGWPGRPAQDSMSPFGFQLWPATAGSRSPCGASSLGTPTPLTPESSRRAGPCSPAASRPPTWREVARSRPFGPAGARGDHPDCRSPEAPREGHDQNPADVQRGGADRVILEASPLRAGAGRGPHHDSPRPARSGGRRPP